MLTRNRVVITGLGIVAPNGIGKDDFWNSLLAAKSAIDQITLFAASQHSSRIAGEVKNFDPKVHLEGTEVNARRLARHTQFALAAALMALNDARLTEQDVKPKAALPLVLGVSTSAFDIIEDAMERMMDRGPERVPTHVVHASNPHQAATLVSQYVPLITRALTISSACAAGVDAIGVAADMIRTGKVDVAVCGGTDACVTPLAFAVLAKAGLLSMRNADPEKASRPFDVDRDSGVISEGAGLVILENLDHARGRGVEPYMEITGHSTRLDPDLSVPGSGFYDTMTEALANAGRRASDVSYISAHGPGHPVLDRVETAMIKKVFGKSAYGVPVSSIKGVIGNPLSAAGALQVISCCLAVRLGIIPPTANLDVPDPECDLDYVPRVGRRARISCALVNSHGVGGGNTTLVLETVKPS